jgi:sugar lactone lactonase YvrE
MIEGWAKLPEGRTWGSTSAVGIDRDGESVWVAERCGANSCRLPNSYELAPIQMIMKFDRNGNMLTSFGAGLAVFPHGLHVDRQGNIWLTADSDSASARLDVFSPEGAWLGRIVLPETFDPFTPSAWGADRVYVSRQDEEGVPYIARYRIAR